MADITSTTYTVVSESKSGDQFVMVRGGQVKKLTRQGLVDLIAEEAPDTILELTDTPTSYLSQQGKVLAVNATETGMEFVSSDLAPSFITAPDTPSSYSGEANKWPVVNGAENALVFQSPVFTYLSDTPANYTGAASKRLGVNGTATGIEFVDNTFALLTDTPATFVGEGENVLRVNAAETGVEFVTPTEIAPARNLTGGWFDYGHGGPNQAYSTPGTFVKIVNDAAGASRSDFAPAGVTTIYDGTGSQFDFTQLSVGDEVSVRVDMSVTTTAVNQTVDINMTFAIGGTPFDIAFSRNQFKTAGTYQVTPQRSFYLGETVQPNPAEVKFRSDSNATLIVQGWFVTVTRLGAL